jgi:hypothetical protein
VDANRVRFDMEETTTIGKWYSGPFTKAYNRFVTAYAGWEDAGQRTPMIVSEMEGAQKEFVPLFRELYKHLRGNIAVNDNDFVGMGLPKPHAGGGAPAPIMKTPPDVRITTLPGNRVSLEYSDAESPHSRAKPRGQHGVEIRWDFSETPITDTEKLTHSIFDTASPAILNFNSSDRGRAVYLVLRWENTRGEKGPWTDIYAVFVP